MVPSLLLRRLWASFFWDPTKEVQDALGRRGAGAPYPGSPGQAWAPSTPRVSSWGPDAQGWRTSSRWGARVREKPSHGWFPWRHQSPPSGAASPQGPQPLSPAPCREAPGGSAPPGPLPGPAPHTLTETREPPSCSVDALAAVSLGSTERQQPLAVTVAKRHQQPARVGVTGWAAAAAPIPGSPGHAHLLPDVPAERALAGCHP